MTWGKINLPGLQNTTALQKYVLTYPIAPYGYKTTMTMADNVYINVGLYGATQTTIGIAIRKVAGNINASNEQFMWFSVGQY